MRSLTAIKTSAAVLAHNFNSLAALNSVKSIRAYFVLITFEYTFYQNNIKNELLPYTQ